MPNLKDLIKAVKNDLPITVPYDRWISDNPNPVWSASALQLAQDVYTGKVGGHRKRKTLFRSSGAGTCPRRRMFSAIGVPEKLTIDGKLGNIFLTGNALHLKWQMAGLTAGWLAEAEVPKDREDLNFGGTLDGVLSDGSGFELKSINDRGYRDVMDNGPKPLHLRQTHSYMLLDPAIDMFSVVYENKNDGEWKEFRIRRDEELYLAIEDEIRELNALYQARQLPPVLNSCSTREGAEYRNCPFKDMCLETKRWPSGADH